MLAPDSPRTIDRCRGVDLATSIRFAALSVTILTCVNVASAVAHEGHHHPESKQSVDHHGSTSPTTVTTSRPDTMILPAPPPGDDVFHFVIYGDRTGGVPAGLKVLEQAVVDTNLLDPDLVMTVGDLIQGYNETDQWLEQMHEFKAIVNRLNMKWYPVAGNHDIYWRGQTSAPQGHHEANYEKHFGPLWYSFAHKNAGFIVLYSDEGDTATNLKAFNVGTLQNMSDEQLEFLQSALEDHSDRDHVFVFLHHPRWIGGGYEGSNWPRVHELLAKVGNVTAVFAGHIHHMRYDGEKDGIAYYALATTGGALHAEIPDAGYLHHLNMVTVRKERISVSAIPIGTVMDPKKFTPEFLAEVEAATKIRCRQTSPELVFTSDEVCHGEVTFAIKNPGSRDVDITLATEPGTSDNGWQSSLDHSHFLLRSDETKELTFSIARNAGALGKLLIPKIRMQVEVLMDEARVRLPTIDQYIKIVPGRVPASFFSGNPDQALMVTNEDSAIRVESKNVQLHDGPFTAEAWVRPTSIEGYRGVLAKTENSEFAIFSNEGAPEFSVHVGGRYVVAKSKRPMIADQWTHIAGVYDGEFVRLFVDGAKVDSQVAHVEGTDRAGVLKRKRNDLPLYIGADT
ncbi:MAG: LamG-like jellyroll fold domain-containing protein, partial [Rhodopirellula sp. JB053]